MNAMRHFTMSDGNCHETPWFLGSYFGELTFILPIIYSFSDIIYYIYLFSEFIYLDS